MTDVSSLAVARFMRLARRSADVWQGGLVRLPTWVDDEQGRPERPWAAVWVSRQTGMVNVQLGDAEADWRLALDSLIELGLKFTKCRPAGLEVVDAEMGRRLVDALGDRELALTVVPALSDATAMVERMATEIRGAAPAPGALEGRGMTVARLRAFAEAARDLYAAAPWRYLSDEDLVRVEAPAMPRALRFFCVMGEAGLTFGLAFFPSARAFETAEAEFEVAGAPGERRWSVLFDAPWKTPVADLDLWEAEDLPLAGESAYPAVLGFEPDGGLRRPDAAMLGRIEAVLRALARTTEAEIDGGRWSHEVPTADGPQRVTLAIPALLELAEEGPAGKPSLTAQRQAEVLVTEALGARGRARVVLARRALAHSPDCAQAYGLLAEATADSAEACELYRQGMAVAERNLGPGWIEAAAGRIWLDVETRPYMRLRLGLAVTLARQGRHAEAIAHYQALLRLNPGDNQGARYLCLAALLLARRDAEVCALLAQYPDDADTLWGYGHALWRYRREGDSREARRTLQAALRWNRRVPAYLTGARVWEGRLPDEFEAGSDEEAAICAAELGEAWRATDGAIDWVRRRGK